MSFGRYPGVDTGRPRGLLRGAYASLVWLRHYHEDGPATYSVYSLEGAWLNEVEMPAGLKVLAIGNGRIVGVVKDEFDVEYLQVWEYSYPAPWVR